jgi:hypothetical protein
MNAEFWIKIDFSFTIPMGETCMFGEFQIFNVE